MLVSLWLVNIVLTRKLNCVAVKLNANRTVVGTLRGFDQFMNLVIDNTVEVNGDGKTDIGMVVIRGNSVVTVEALEPVARPQG
ncbi:putative small nuclear ribonucleoprotein G-like [Dorcoceras hygrometricum]|uniref:Small nuclear ribonucleoprotein G n=1 Tax=Dorcoceras hygrometricum TaxID=472368 RepID=A0A2Z7B242_9LAMI|nr:putative small nuclear ribonucleoprotein G-like [Dorcoceras hygrometricum]